MNTKFKLLIALIPLVYFCSSCNPECEFSSRSNIIMDRQFALPESEFLLKSSPPNFLVDREVYINDPSGGNGKVSVEYRYSPELSGTIVTLPAEAPESTPIFVEDPDCSGDFIYVNDVQIKSEDFFISSDLFVVPPIPIVVIPAPLPPPPINVTNAWITPYDRAYCIWFVPEYDENLNEKIELRPFIEGEAPQPTNLNAPNDFLVGSREFVVCNTAGQNPLANVNPVSGIIDKDNNFISIRIDRTSKGLGVEQFTGMFIDPDQNPKILPDEDWRFGGACGGRNDPSPQFMLLTSTSTGQQMLMIKALPKLE